MQLRQCTVAPKRCSDWLYCQKSRHDTLLNLSTCCVVHDHVWLFQITSFPLQPHSYSINSSLPTSSSVVWKLKYHISITSNLKRADKDFDYLQSWTQAGTRKFVCSAQWETRQETITFSVLRQWRDNIYSSLGYWTGSVNFLSIAAVEKQTKEAIGHHGH